MIRTHQMDAALHITLSGQLSLSALYDLTAILMQVTDTCEEYCLDMSEVVTISDGALAALAMFLRRARRVGRRTHLTGCHWWLSSRLAELSALHELSEQTTCMGMAPQAGLLKQTEGPQLDPTVYASDYRYIDPDLPPSGTEREVHRIIWH